MYIKYNHAEYPVGQRASPVAPLSVLPREWVPARLPLASLKPDSSLLPPWCHICQSVGPRQRSNVDS